MICFECGDKADYEHYVIPKILGGTKTIPICGKCHNKIHNNNSADINTSRLTKLALKKEKR